jgi:hypothetical protein
MNNKLTNLDELYTYLDNLFDQKVDSDTLFASGYLRGFISLSATSFGDDTQKISAGLIGTITEKLSQAKTELSPQDNVIVQNFWLGLQGLMQKDAIN